MCYEKYPTIVNNVPKDKNVYSSSMDDYAKLDNLLSASQTDIGESSNLAQVAQSYSYTFDSTEYDDYVAILSVLAQLAIDSAKKQFDIDIPAEIKRIKQQMKVKENKYPIFWSLIRRGFNKELISKSLHCPMNYLYDLKIKKPRSSVKTLPMSYFFKQYELKVDRRKCKKVEELIQKYSFDLYNYNVNNTNDYLLLRSDFDQLLYDISQINISKDYLGFMSYLINRCFLITPGIQSDRNIIKSKVNKNKSLLMNVLYNVNKKSLFSVLSNNLYTDSELSEK